MDKGDINHKSRAIDPVARNAYRVLGLPGSAALNAIYAASRSMLRACKLDVSKTTPWDLPWLGPLNRSESDVQSANGRITNPSSRLRERMFWFFEGQEIVELLSPPSLNNAAIGWASAPRPSARHDAALLNFIAAIVIDPIIREEERWLQVISDWQELIESDEYWSALLNNEINGGFEPPATSVEIIELRREALKLVIDALGTISRESLDRKDIKTCQRAIRVLRKARLPKELLIHQENSLIGPLKNALESLCSKVISNCRNNVKHKNGYEQANLAVCHEALDRFHKEIESSLKVITKISGHKSELGCQAREDVALCLLSLGIEYTWADEHRLAVDLLFKAKEIAPPDSVPWVRIEQSMASIFEGFCKYVRFQCGENINREGTYKANLPICQTALKKFDDDIEPTLTKILNLWGENSDIGRKAREAGALCLYGLALDYTWADEAGMAEALLKKAKQLAPPDSKSLKDIEEKLQSVSENARVEELFRGLKPIDRAPSLSTTNGFGFRLYGKTDIDPIEGSYLTTYYFVALGIPLIPICRYRVVDKGRGMYSFLWKAPLRNVDRLHLGLVLAGLAALLFLITSDNVSGPPQGSYQSSRSWNSEVAKPAPVPAFSGGKFLPELSKTITDTKFYVSSLKANVRKAPNKMAPVLAEFEMGQEVNELKREGEWVQVGINKDQTTDNSSNEGWIHSSVLKSKEELLGALKENIESGRSQIPILEAKLKSMKLDIDNLKKEMGHYKMNIDHQESQARLGLLVNDYNYKQDIQEYNLLVEEHNKLLSEGKSIFDKYQKLINHDNFLVEKYNTLLER